MVSLSWTTIGANDDYYIGINFGGGSTIGGSITDIDDISRAERK